MNVPKNPLFCVHVSWDCCVGRCVLLWLSSLVPCVVWVSVGRWVVRMWCSTPCLTCMVFYGMIVLQMERMTEWILNPVYSLRLVFTCIHTQQMVVMLLYTCYTEKQCGKLEIIRHKSVKGQCLGWEKLIIKQASPPKGPQMWMRKCKFIVSYLSAWGWVWWSFGTQMWMIYGYHLDERDTFMILNVHTSEDQKGVHRTWRRHKWVMGRK